MPPLVSVIIATYNRSNVLPFSIGSVLQQTLGDFELLVVGDGCTDDSAAVVQAITDPRVHWFNLPNNSGHQSEPNNEGLRLAKGKYIAYLGHDDLWLPHHLKSLVDEMEKGADLAYGLTLMLPSKLLERQLFPFLAEYSHGMWIPPSSMLHKKSVTDGVGGWRHYQELVQHPEAELWMRAGQANYKFACSGRLTAIKFPAGKRKDVYKTRDCHEQTAWFKRIQEEENFERTELVKTLFTTTQALCQAFATKPYCVLWRELAQETRSRLKQRLFPTLPKKGASVETMRKYKGLKPKSR